MDNELGLFHPLQFGVPGTNHLPATDSQGRNQELPDPHLSALPFEISYKKAYQLLNKFILRLNLQFDY
jgi:hypothetical protein